jgi:hypothetical protein
MGPLGDIGKSIQKTVGIVEKGVETAIDSVTQGVGKATSEGIASAKTTFETVVHKTDEVVKKVIDAALSGLQQTPKSFFSELAGNTAKVVQETAKHVQDKALNVQTELKSVGGKLNQEGVREGQVEMQKLSQMQGLLSKLVQSMHDMDKSIMQNIRG